ncbi:CTD kinase subunit beta [Golovinomyces cichoracearum]|uniref:CTD kinase subunit beta n=1 Tax=Golovinomyces cichoracearum TaxID=62708 RepID=A0A420H8I7_9PEZI|nr:CTD kinase subunit beta [Golovinomyces cichoracearum]
MASNSHQSNGHTSVSNSGNDASSTSIKPRSRMYVSSQYIFQQQLQTQLNSNGTVPTREDNLRLLGIQWISDTRQALQLPVFFKLLCSLPLLISCRPVRTFCTAATYYHRFRLIHKENEYQYQDAAAGALLAACKIEDTLKKSKEIICAAHNLKVPPAEHLSFDDSIFEGHSKVVIGLERLMLEASGFDFRVRYPQKHLVKVAKEIRLERSTYHVAYDIMTDLFRTFAPLKQTSTTMCFACLELATLLINGNAAKNRNSSASFLYKKCYTTRAEILETILDLLDLYTHFQKSSIIGPLHNIDKFIKIRIALNQELEQNHSLSRYTGFHESIKSNGVKKTPITPITPGSPSNVRKSGDSKRSPAILSPRSEDSGRRGAVKGQDITIRFVLDVEQAKKEKKIVSEYFETKYEEIEVDVEEPMRPPQEDQGSRGQTRGRDDRYSNYNSSKRARR